MKWLLKLIMPILSVVAAKATPELVSALRNKVKQLKEDAGKTTNEWDDVLWSVIGAIIGVD